MPCDMCGKEAELFITEVEGTELQVCKDCSGFGSVKRKISTKPAFERKILPKQVKPEIIEVINPEYASMVKKKRESLSISQENFAKKINEKVSLIHHIETGKTEPSIALAKKLERFLNISLVKQDEQIPVHIEKSSSEAMTIGDMIKVKKS
ncbi:MAG: multiprotein bridging factor aMBF1 [Candidatus Woesearchaeota archaeon]|nr:multiprotein bridging factor aMBF1 [Candidatus Woesearchaeota archaeon]MDP7180019.1 multiprotein bridging factor aMBF1 [Candidatus Woesearchaeota archaeon]